jgi:hypothetical protein
MFEFPAQFSFGRVNWSIGATYNNTSITNRAHHRNRHPEGQEQA